LSVGTLPSFQNYLQSFPNLNVQGSTSYPACPQISPNPPHTPQATPPFCLLRHSTPSVKTQISSLFPTSPRPPTTLQVHHSLHLPLPFYLLSSGITILALGSLTSFACVVVALTPTGPALLANDCQVGWGRCTTLAIQTDSNSRHISLVTNITPSHLPRRGYHPPPSP
ncbi:unnamed protein product, partial [Choristocarpus tenellus]